MDEIQHKIMGILKRRKAIMTDSHFVYASGRHGAKYINKDVIFSYPVDMRRIAEVMYLRLGVVGIIKDDLSNKPEIVIGPVVGGAIIAQWVAYNSLDSVRGMIALYADKEDVFTVEYDYPIHEGKVRLCKVGTKFVIKRGYDKLIKDKRVLVVEDIMTTGISVKKVVKAVEDCGGEIVAVSVIINRGGVIAEDIGVKHLCSLIEVDFESYAPEDCPLCKEGIPINTEFGKGKEFVKGESENEI